MARRLWNPAVEDAIIEATVLDQKPTLRSVVEVLEPLDLKKFECFLTVSFADDVELGSAQALAKVLAVMDCQVP